MVVTPIEPVKVVFSEKNPSSHGGYPVPAGTGNIAHGNHKGFLLSQFLQSGGYLV